MKTTYTLALLATLSTAALAQDKTPTRPKIPHSHHLAHGGSLLMFGDDHVETTKTADGKGLLVFLSDKLRDPLQASDFALELSVVDGSKVSKLTLTPNPQTPYELKAVLPPGLSENSQLEIKALRKTARSGYVTSDRPQKLLLAKVPAMKPMSPAAHSGH